MTIYHLVRIFQFFAGVEGFNFKGLVDIDTALLERSIGLLEAVETNTNTSSIIAMSALLIFIDMIFLVILSVDFKKLNLTWERMGYIEVIIFILAVFIPEFRVIMIFLSLDTLQIFVFYHITTYFDKYSLPINPFSFMIVSIGYWWMLKIISYTYFNLYV